MRVLHYVERDAQAGHVVLATSDGHEQFELTVDAALRAAIVGTESIVVNASASASGATNGATIRTAAEPRISPREIQMRVRGGEMPESLADAYGAGLDWVLRFAGPVLAERERIANEARRAKARRSTTEGQTVVFGEAVNERFAAHGIEPTDVGWDAHRREDGQWIVTASWVGGQSERSAQWAFQLAGRTVAPLDDTAADLLSDRPIRPIVTPDAEPVPPSLSLAPPLAPGLVAFPAMPDAHTGPLPRPEEVFDQAMFDEPHLPMHVPGAPPATASTTATASTPRAASSAAKSTEQSALPSTGRIPKLTNLGIAQRGDETEDEKAARASIPSWDDILLGVRRKND